jgi:hypothetical protein
MPSNAIVVLNVIYSCLIGAGWAETVRGLNEFPNCGGNGECS